MATVTGYTAERMLAIENSSIISARKEGHNLILTTRGGTDHNVGDVDGNGVVSSEVRYAVSNSGTTTPTTGWVASPPTTSAGQYLWTRTVFTNRDDTQTSVYSVGRHGLTGPSGEISSVSMTPLGHEEQPYVNLGGVPSNRSFEFGLPVPRSVDSTSVNYNSSTSATTPPTSGWSQSIPTVPQGQFLWTRVVSSYTDSTTETYYSVARQGVDGSGSVISVNGKDGVVDLTASDVGAVPAAGSSSTKRVYTVESDGTQSLTGTSNSTSGNIAVRTSSGNIIVPTTPNGPQAATSKSYVDNSISSKILIDPTTAQETSAADGTIFFYTS